MKAESLPEAMRAWTTDSETGPDGLVLRNRSLPVYGPTDLLVRVRATALNRADLLQSFGKYPAPPGAPKEILGLEFAGEIAAVGRQVVSARIGDRVMGLVGGGAWAEFVATPETEAVVIPQGLSFADAAAIPEAFLTSWDALVTQAGIGTGSAVLIHAVGGGIGTAALQVVAALGGVALGTARSSARLDFARGLGLAQAIAIDEDPPKFAARVHELVPGGVQCALELVGGRYVNETLQTLAPGGTLMLLGLLDGRSAHIDLGTILGKHLRILGSTLRQRSLEGRRALATTLRDEIAPRLASRAFRAVVGAVHPFEDAPKVLAGMGRNAQFGKSVLTL